jgi:hypothetical protein
MLGGMGDRDHYALPLVLLHYRRERDLMESHLFVIERESSVNSIMSL